MAASIRSLRNGITPVDNASRDDLVVGDVVTVTALVPATTYAWSIVFAPQGSTATFSGSPVAVSPGTFTVDIDGPYLVRLVVDAAMPTESTQYVRLRSLTSSLGLRLVAAGERRDGSGIIPVDADAEGWANDQNFNLQTLEAAISGGGVPALSAVLVVGNTTSGSNITLSDGDTLRSDGPMVLNYGAAGGVPALQGRVGGNSRGTGSVDLQKTATAPTQVASGDYATISGGRENTASGTYSVVPGGTGNTAGGLYSVLLGSDLLNGGGSPAPSAYMFGTLCTVPDGAGSDNIAIGYANTSGSNGVSTVDGCIAIGSSNFAPAGAFLGSYAPTMAIGQSNAATGYSAMAIGYSNTASWLQSIAIGYYCTSSSFYSISIGYQNSANAYGSVAIGGFGNVAANNLTRVSGENCQATVYGEDAYGTGQFATKGDARRSEVVLRCTTVGVVSNTLKGDGSTAGRQYTLEDGSCIQFFVQIVAKNVSTAPETVAGFTATGIAKYLSGVVTVVGATITADPANEFAGTVAILADSPNAAVSIIVQGVGTDTIRWVATFRAARVL